MGVAYFVKGSDPDTSPYLHVANVNAMTIARLLELPLWDGGSLRASKILRRIKVVRKLIKQHRPVMEDALRRETKVIRLPGAVAMTQGCNIERVEEYLDKLEEIASFAGADGRIHWG